MIIFILTILVGLVFAFLFALVSVFKITNIEELYTAINIVKSYIYFKSLNCFINYTKSGLVEDVEIPLGDNKSEIINVITYFRTDTMYKIAIPKGLRGPRAIKEVIDYHGDDETEYVNLFLGPHRNFHGIPTTPNMLKLSSPIKVIYKDREQTYEENDVIALV